MKSIILIIIVVYVIGAIAQGTRELDNLFERKYK
jgi:hypothetical protein